MSLRLLVSAGGSSVTSFLADSRLATPPRCLSQSLKTCSSLRFSTQAKQFACSLSIRSAHVPRERIELSWVTPYDFESYASANSATAAKLNFLPKNYEMQNL